MSTTSTNSKLHCFKHVNEFCSTSFDFLIIGGGTAGLTLANRLSENASWKIGVLEAGQYFPDDPMIQVPSSWPQLLISPKYTWQMHSVPQKRLDNRPVFIPTGKALGGSSSINMMMYLRAGKLEYDSWDTIGNPGWNWEELLPYFKKAEHYYPEGITCLDPKRSVEQDTASSTPNFSEFHGSEGNIKVTYANDPTELEVRTAKAFESLGIRFNNDQGSGDATGFFPSGRSIAPVTQKRWSSVNGYLEGISSRPNLYVLTEAIVTRVLFDERGDSSSQLHAIGVEFLYKDVKYTATACREVIISAGALKTPQILELSGIGDKARLMAHGVPSLLDLPAVGENLMDHVSAPVRIKLRDASIALKPGEVSRPIPAACFCSLHDLCPSEAEVRLKQIFDEELHASQLTPLQKAQYEIQRQFLDKDVGLCEIVIIGIQPVSGPNAFTVVPVLQHPVARGSVHIKSTDPLTNPEVDLRYFDNSFDTEVMKEAMKLIDRLFKSDALAGCLLDYSQPANLQSFDSFKDEDFRDFLAKYSNTIFHPIGTAVMAPRELGGVVDPSLKVYGTVNLRIIDASIFPLHIASHPQASIYAIAEKAADIIKAENV